MQSQFSQNNPQQIIQNNIYSVNNNQQFDQLKQNIPIYCESIEYYPQQNIFDSNHQQNFQLTNPIQRNYLQIQLLNQQQQQQQYIQQQQQQFISSQYTQHQQYFQQQISQHQSLGLTNADIQTTQIIRIEDKQSNNLSGGIDMMTQSDDSQYIFANNDEIKQECEELRPSAISTSITCINQSLNNDLITCNSFNQTSQSLSPTTICSPKNKRQSSLNINSLQHIQDQSYDNQNLSTQQLDQSFNQSYCNSQTSEKSSPTFITSDHSLPLQQNGQKSTDSQSDNRRIIQTYQKISKINVNKNIIKAFKKFMLDKENSDIVTSFGFINQSKNQCNLMKTFFDSLNHNNQSVTRIIDHPIYGGAFEFFLTFYAEPWLQLSRVQDKDAHFIAIDFFKLCCSENKVKLSNFKYYSKRKNDNKKVSNTDKSSSSKSKSQQKQDKSEQDCNLSSHDEMESVFIYQINQI